MGNLYISEFADLLVIGSAHSIEAAHQPTLVDSVVPYSGTPGASAAFNAKTNYVRIHTDAICSILFGDTGATPVAATTNARMIAGQTEYFAVQPGAKVSAIANT